MSLNLGCSVVLKDGRVGEVLFIGKLPRKQGKWVGICLTDGYLPFHSNHSLKLLLLFLSIFKSETKKIVFVCFVRSDGHVCFFFHVMGKTLSDKFFQY